MIVFLLSLFYFATRIPFLRTYSVYYDSFEYIRIIGKLNWQNIASVTSSSHQPIHTLYFITGLLLKSLLPSLSVEVVMAMSSLLFGYGITIIWYLLVKRISNKKTALFSTILLLLFPYFFIANTHILYESELLFFQIASMYVLFIACEKRKYIYFIIAGLLLGLAHLLFIGTLFIIPLYFFIVLNKIKNQLKTTMIFGAVFGLGYFLAGFFLDFLVLQSLPLLITKYIKHAGDVVANNQGLLYLLGRIIRNIVFQSNAILSGGGIILLTFSCIVLAYKKKYSFLLLIPFFVLMQYWHAGFFGRLAIGIIFPAAFIIASTFTNIKTQIAKIVILLLFFIWIPWRQLALPPLYAYYNLILNEKNITVITSDYNRFLYEKYAVPHFTIKGDTAREEIKKYIETNFKSKTVLIDSSALRYPYFQYDGSGYNIMSMRSNGAPLIGNLLDSYTYKEFKKEPFSDIFFLRILSKKKKYCIMGFICYPSTISAKTSKKY